MLYSTDSKSAMQEDKQVLHVD